MIHFAFTKIVVGDLEASAAFYAETFGLVEQTRVTDAIGGRRIDEILYRPTVEGGASLVLLTFADGPAPAGVIPGFVTDELDAVFERGVAAGGSVHQAPMDMPAHGHRVGFLADPEGRIIEVVQALA